MSSRFQFAPIVLAFSALVSVSAAQASAAEVSAAKTQVAPTAQVAQPLAAQSLVTLSGQRPNALLNAKRLVPLAPNSLRSALITLPLRNTSQLDALITALHDPSSPLYGQYLTPQQFTQRFAPTQADYDAVVAFAHSKGLTVTPDEARTFVKIQARTSVMEAALNVRFNTYQTDQTGRNSYQREGNALTPARIFFAPDRDPKLPAAIAGKILGIVGLDNAAQVTRKPFSGPASGPLVPGLTANALTANALTPNITVPNYNSGNNPSVGTGNPYSIGFGPQDLRKAYGLEGVPATGKGQVIAIYDEAGFSVDDSTQYKLQYHLPDTPVVGRYFAGYAVTPTDKDTAREAALDIDMALAFSPEAKEILVYSAYVDLNTETAETAETTFLQALAAVAKDNVAGQFNISYSFGNINAFSAAAQQQRMKQLAAQGITVFASSGDEGYYGSQNYLTSPASDPYVTSVGATALFTNPDGSYQGEEVANDFITSAGGYDAGYPIPSYQQTGILGAFDTTTNGGSNQYRNLPDVSATGSFFPGLAVYTDTVTGDPQWLRFAGTSASSPIWAGFMGTVNQVRTQAGLGRIGFANPALYSIAQLNTSPTFPFAGAFHDVIFGDDNDHVPGDPIPYTAGPGYDNVTGNGSFDGEKMIGALCFISGSKYAPPAVPTKFTATPGSKSVKLTWAAATGAKGYLIYRTPSVSPNPASIGYLTALTGTSYTDTAVTSGTVYQYKLMAVGSGGGIFAAPVAVTPGP